jgi:3-oxoadipate enol-lactonase
VVVPDRGEFFLRDTHPQDGGSRPVVFMLHGWIGSADLNFAGLYDAVVAAGYRVVALDHRGHGRGLRSIGPFRLVDCADDAAGVIERLELGRAIIYGYSMGGAIAQLLADRRPDLIAGMVLSGTCQHWQEDELKRTWKAMPFVGLGLSVAPARGWRVALKRAGFTAGPRAAWLQSEMMRHSARDIGEAGRELGRFDSRPWLKPLSVPTAVVVTTADDAVPPAKQRELVAALAATAFEAPVRHLDVGALADSAVTDVYNRVFIEALESLRVTDSSGSLPAT